MLFPLIYDTKISRIVSITLIITILVGLTILS